VKIVLDWDESSEDVAAAIRRSITNMMGINADSLEENNFNIGTDEYSADPSGLRDMAEAFESAANRLEDPNSSLESFKQKGDDTSGN